MPGMNGLELQDELNRRGAVIPVVFITGHGDVPMAVEAMRHGATDFLQKPFSDKDLTERIERALATDRGNRRYLARRTGFVPAWRRSRRREAGVAARNAWQGEQGNRRGIGHQPAHRRNPSRPPDGEDGRYLTRAIGPDDDERRHGYFYVLIQAQESPYVNWPARNSRSSDGGESHESHALGTIPGNRRLFPESLHSDVWQVAAVVLVKMER